MYGITNDNGTMVLCHYRAEDNSYILKRWDILSAPVMKSSPFDIDELMQQYTVASNNYTLRVFQFTEDDEARLIMRRLRGIY